MGQRLFVYGTLRPGESNERFLADIPGKWMNACITGILFPNGYGATDGYPALMPDKNGQLIQGQVLEANFTEADWQILDDFETEAYQRVIDTVVTEDGKCLSAFVYILNQHDLNRLSNQG
mgnify:CR=1 FL=1|tara:strand:+ start:1035 stop:1394 length:360 start_codon:yes stop_codon:yes gene_type:complete